MISAVAMLHCTTRRLVVSAFAPSLQFSPRRTFVRSVVVLRNELQVDGEGRRIRGGRDDDGGWDDFDPTENRQPSTTTRTTDNNSNSKRKEDDSWGAPSPRRTRTTDNSRTDFGAGRRDNARTTSNSRSDFGASRRDSSRSDFGASRRDNNNGRRGDSSQRTNRNDDNNGRRGDFSQRSNRNADDNKPERKINMKALESAGFVHLYGLTPVLNALQAAKRDMTRPEDRIKLEELEGEAYQHELAQRDRKPEAQFSPWLLVQGPQQQKANAARSRDKQAQAEQVLELAESRGVPVAYVDKGVLNALSGDRPHQGYVLRCGKLFFETLSRIPLDDKHDASHLWLVLDEVVDPQNLGALIRSAFFLGAGKVSILVCAKNSAPPSPAVSAASAGALELVNVYSTSNLPRTLASAEQDGFRIVGASSSLPKDSDDSTVMYELGDDEFQGPSDKPTILVLGSEGHGLRSLVARSCTEFVRISGGDSEGVDSLNVSVTGGILLWHLLQGLRR
jgi:21S rRNA (GM2251-2'-O)-methyltransferase